jgi:ectoine hydroxylase-related dioxygenase (phytanoyl-CoA dioxygenase family)
MIARPNLLTPSELDRYRREGYVIPRYRLPAREVDALRAAVDTLIADNPGIRPERLVNAHLEGSAEGVKGSRLFLDLARAPALLDLVASAIGPDIVLWGCQVFCKPGGDGMEVPWHQDGHYWPIRPLATCTAWVALDESKPENGCMRVIPGSHRARALFPHLTEDRADVVLTQRASEDAFDARTAADVALEPGEMSLHDIYMIHGSNPNRSPKRRAGVAIRYMPATSHFDRALMPPSSANGYPIDFSQRPIWLLRGVDRSGKNDFAAGHG